MVEFTFLPRRRPFPMREHQLLLHDNPARLSLCFFKHRLYCSINAHIVLQGYVCFCRPCIPAPAHKKAASTLAKTLGSTAFSIVVTIITLVVVAVALLVYSLNRDLRVPVVSNGWSACQDASCHMCAARCRYASCIASRTLIHVKLS